MGVMTERETELKALREKLRSRKDKPGFSDNVKAIEARIAELEAQ